MPTYTYDQGGGNLNNGERFETYTLYGRPGAGLIELNGATAHLGRVGDRLTIMSFARYSAEEAATHEPRVIVLDEHNRVVRPPNFGPALHVIHG